jgi:hypothetical protein
MSTGALIGIIIVVIIVAAVVVVASAQLRRARMRRQFGPEYDRLAKEMGPRKADTELSARQRRVEALDIHPLPAEQQARYSGDWTVVQERFVDTPAEALSAAGTLIWDVMRDRGYPVNDRKAAMEALSVYHARSLEGYRQAQDLGPEPSTEQLRGALIRYRALFEDLTGLREGQGQPARDRMAEIGGRDAVDDRVAADNGGLMAEDGDGTATSARTRDRELTAEDPDRTADTTR